MAQQIPTIPEHLIHLFKVGSTYPIPAWMARGDGRFRLLATGWRGWPEDGRRIIMSRLSAILSAIGFVDRVTGQRTVMVVVDGECPYGGVDAYAHRWAIEHCGLGVTSERFPARVVNGRILGPERNSKMIEFGADAALAFPGPRSRGTIDCMAKLFEANVPTWVTAYQSDYANDVRAGRLW